MLVKYKYFNCIETIVWPPPPTLVTGFDEDMIVYTSGAGGLFRSGIPIGKIDINSFENEDQKINFYSDFSQLKFVKILSYKKEEN